jgi:hypothetical protein
LIRGIHLFRPREEPPWHHGVLQWGQPVFQLRRYMAMRYNFTE